MAQRGGVFAGSYVSEYLRNLTESALPNDMAVDSSTSFGPDTYSYLPTKDFLLGRMMVWLQDGTAFAAGEFGALGTALTDGVSIQIGGVEIENWKDNIDVLSTMYDASRAGEVLAIPTQVIHGRWTLYRASPAMDGIYVPAGVSVSAVVSDNLSALIAFRIKIQGILVA